MIFVHAVSIVSCVQISRGGKTVDAGAVFKS